MKYEKLINQSKMDKSDMTDGQCVSHTQHIELSRDKLNEYGINYGKLKEQEKHLSLGFQKGEGGFQFNANAAASGTPPVEPTPSTGGDGLLFPIRQQKSTPSSRADGQSSIIRLSPKERQSYIRQVGPPGRREPKVNRKRKWETF